MSINIEDVVVIGGGPVGLLMGLSLHKRGIPFTILEERTEVVPDSRSLGIHPVSLDIFDELEITSQFLEKGIKVRQGVAHSGQKELGRINFEIIPGSHKYILLLPQSETESILKDELKKRSPGSLLEGCELTGLEQHDDMVTITFLKDGDTHSADIGYAIGCDGKNSFVRDAAGIEFSGKKYPDTYIMGDFADNTEYQNDAVVYLPKGGLIECFPSTNGIRRWVVKTDTYVKEPTAEMITEIIDSRIGIKPDPASASMVSSFGVQQYFADQFVKDRVCLAGDAAHVVSPIGGQGMNLGWMDAWHLANVMSFCRGISKDQPIADLFIYESKQKPIARKVANRAEWNMKLGRKSLFPSFKHLIVRRMLKAPFHNIFARRFTMSGLE